MQPFREVRGASGYERLRGMRWLGCEWKELFREGWIMAWVRGATRGRAVKRTQRMVGSM